MTGDATTGEQAAEPVRDDAGDRAAAATAEMDVEAGTDTATTSTAAKPGEGTTADTSAAAGESATETAAATAEPGSPSSTPWFSGRRYSVVAGDTLWDLSDRNYVNPYYWPHIWNHNQSLANPDRIEIDQVLWLPRLEGEPRDLSAADRRSIAEGYLRLYRLWKETGAANPQYALVGVRYFDAAVMPPELRNDPSAGRPSDALAAAFEALLLAEFPIEQ
ncbi:MAG: LysM domain-containing protein [Halofilum sp. (in: g-proteobacteria)]|nr:LysM domain-containing protein [Halofilum sp. (in: g-proteobacteria)]